MITYNLTEQQRAEMEMIFATCLISLRMMLKQKKRISESEMQMLRKAQDMYLGYSEIFKPTDGSQTQLDKFSYKPF